MKLLHLIAKSHEIYSIFNGYGVGLANSLHWATLRRVLCPLVYISWGSCCYHRSSVWRSYGTVPTQWIAVAIIALLGIGIMTEYRAPACVTHTEMA